MTQLTVYGFPDLGIRNWEKGVDFAKFSNEDIGFIANLVTGTNEVYNFALPFPASVDIDEETIKLFAIEFLYQANLISGAITTFQALSAFLSMLDKDFTATFLGIATDTEDEALKSKFAENILFGRTKGNIAATASVESGFKDLSSTVSAIYYPPEPLRLVTPLFIDLVNQSQLITLATGAGAAANFTDFERVMIKPWFKIVKLTKDEMGTREAAMRFLRLDS